MRALNSLAAKMSEKWEMLHFPLRGRRQVLLESEETAQRHPSGSSSSSSTLSPDQKALVLSSEVMNAAASVSSLSEPLTLQPDTGLSSLSP